MKFSNRTWAIILLAFFTIGTLGAVFSFFAGQKELGTSSTMIIIFSGIGTYYLKKQIKAQQETNEKNQQDQQPQQKQD